MGSPLEMFCAWERETPNNIFFRQPIAGQWKTWTYQQAGQDIRRIASGIRGSHQAAVANIRVQNWRRRALVADL